jgi:c-di-GMP-binding flagellar brake protein YcgR
MNQRRKHSRVDIEFPIFCILKDREQNKTLNVSGIIYDLSLGGMKIKVPLPQAFHQAQSIDYSIKLPEPFKSIRGSGDVKWLKRDDVNHVIYFGIAFQALEDHQRADLICIVDELEEAESKNTDSLP